MADYPPGALAAVSLAIHRAACPLRDDPDHDCARDAAAEELFIPRAKAVLDASAPVLAEALLTPLLKRHPRLPSDWGGYYCSTCWNKDSSRPTWPCGEVLAIAALLPERVEEETDAV